MFSPEFMKYLINYQKPEYNESVERKTINFKFKHKNGKLAHVFLLNKK